MQDQATADSAEQRAAKENLGTQRGGLAIAGETAGALKFFQQIEQQQNAADGGFDGEELAQAKIVGSQIAFQFGEAIFHIRPVVVVAPDFFRRQSQVGNEDAEGVGGWPGLWFLSQTPNNTILLDHLCYHTGLRVPCP